MIQPRLPLTLADKIDAFLAAARLHGLRVKALRLSPEEFRELHHDSESGYHDGKYRDIRLRVAMRDGPSPWNKRSFFDGTERRYCTRTPISTAEQLKMMRRAGDTPLRRPSRRDAEGYLPTI